MFGRKPRRVRLMTAENIRLSRPDPQPAPRAQRNGGILIDSAEGTRWAYSDIPLPKPEEEAESIEPQKVEGARMAAAIVLNNEVELPLAPLPEPDIEASAE